VGNRKPSQGLESADRLLRLVRELRQGRPFIRKGVYRFKTFEEAQKASLDAQAGQLDAGAGALRRLKR
jgi:hypothetical protein